MSLVIWYKVEIAEADSGGPGGLVAAVASLTGLGLPVTVSNDMFAGSVVLDAEITVTMTEGAATDTFEITLINLPTATTDLIRAVQATTPLSASIHLGYFDEPQTTSTDVGRVLVGRITRVSGCVGEDGFARTVLYGQEEAGYRLRTRPAAGGRPTATTAVELAGALARDAHVPLANGSTLPGDLTGFTVRSESTLDALRALARRADAPLVVRDGKVYLGAAVGEASDKAPMPFDPDTNIVSLDRANAEDSAGNLTPPVRNTLNLTVLGHPRLRVGQIATITGLSDAPTGTLRLSRVVHRFTTSGGYTAELGLIAADAGERAQVTTGVQGVADRWQQAVDRARDDHPAIDMGEVTEYTTGADGQHLASLHYAQTPDPDVVAPSVASPVDSAVDLHDKPIASVFAFDRTGLVVPVYPKMRALLAHNRGLVNDAVVAGFVWPDNPVQRRPANEPGDFWLALPTGLGDDGLPSGAGANDLIDATGHRVVQAAGLHLVVGADALPEVGTRPAPPDDSSLTIEHQSGTTITIDAGGAVTITTNRKPIRLTNGAVSLKLDGSAVEVS
ncbi:hypothetical protein QMK19_18080 [Streptomyces sp. H10-C2]|uniref:hypothetical protein n=1 Tax=unclassified Streptomyces TaxID=2593676 RepID=UPI0024BBA106|nr:MULTISPECIES: hypothetical protein [unclassified Streptomyces]MDJ0343461.1 hypothetical protein [Streptomyces sp. PH10-H1]MDJ0371541.1 hypothetical protein [Streptomyces sp. H10-C2]